MIGQEYNCQVIRQESEDRTTLIFLCQVPDNGIEKVLQADFIDDTCPLYPSKTNGIIKKTMEGYKYTSKGQNGCSINIEPLQEADKSIQNRFLKAINKIS
jgi:hypothetical protein